VEGRLDCAVLGAGPAGLTAAYVLGLHGAHATVFEAGDSVGGLARTVDFDGCRFDLGGHRFFTKLPPIEEFWEDLLGADLLTRPRLSRIYYRGRYLSYPLNAREILTRLGVAEAALCTVSYLLSTRRSSRAAETFEDWVTARFGKRLYNAFFRSYTEKVWGIPGSQIRSDWAAQRIKNLSLAKAILSALHLRREHVTSLIEEFRYPRLGPGQLWEALRERVEESGIEVRLDSPCVALRHSGKRIESIVADEEHGVGGVVSSMPLGELALKLDPAAPPEVCAAARRLRYRALCVVALVTSEAQPFPDNWIYLQDPGIRAGRVQNYGAWSEAMVRPQTTCLGVEYFCFEGDDVWHMSDEEAVELAKGELEKVGLIDPAKVVRGTKINVPKAYPMYDRDSAGAVDVLRSYLARFTNLQICGRNGLHRYNNQDHAMWTGALAALNLLGAAAYDVWSVNTDADYHELFRAEPAGHASANGNGLVDVFRVPVPDPAR
jgi:protoporphyrinogen oxidase